MVLQTLLTSDVVNLAVRRRRLGGKRYSTTLHFNPGSGETHGLVLDLGVYVSRIRAGSAAAKEGSIAVGDRLVAINNSSLEHVTNITEALQLLTADGTLRSQTLSLTLAKSSASGGGGGGLGNSNTSSSAAVTEGSQPLLVQSPKTVSPAATSPIKDTIRGSQEFVRKLMGSGQQLKSENLAAAAAAGGGGGGAVQRYSSVLGSGSSSEKVYHCNSSPAGSKGVSSTGSNRGLMGTVKEKLDNVRGYSRKGGRTATKESGISKQLFSFFESFKK